MSRHHESVQVLRKPPARLLGWQHRGVALIVVLVVLVALSFTAIAAMRGAMSAGQLANNLITQTQARAAAQTALRYCERALLVESRAVPIWPAAASGNAAAWESFANWAGPGARASSVPLALLSSPEREAAPSTAAQCLAEVSPLSASGATVVTVTARGFSADYSQDNRGRALSGAVVWLQSIVSLSQP